MTVLVPCDRLLQRAYLEFTVRTRNLAKLTENVDKCLQVTHLFYRQLVASENFNGFLKHFFIESY